jgi:ATPase subunit of ABC transporter with duplicated ATPase domains
MVTKIVELYQRQLHFYTGNYDKYEVEKDSGLKCNSVLLKISRIISVSRKDL